MTTPAEKAYREALAAAREAYREAIAAAEEAVEEAVAAAEEAYREAIAAAGKARDELVDAAWEVLRADNGAIPFDAYGGGERALERLRAALLAAESVESTSSDRP